LYCEKQQTLREAWPVWYYAAVRPSTMQNFLALASLSAMLTTLAWSYVTQPLPPDNPRAYHECKQIHPQKFCASNYMPNAQP
jgi:hypothetical protein